MSSFIDVNVYRTRRQVNLEVICRYLLSQFGSVFYVPILRNGFFSLQDFRLDSGEPVVLLAVLAIATVEIPLTEANAKTT